MKGKRILKNRFFKAGFFILISSEEESNSFEINPNNTAELNKKGELIGIEIQNASNYLRDTLLESIQAKILNLSKAS